MAFGEEDIRGRRDGGKGGAESPMARWIRYSGSGCRWLSVYPKRLKDGYGETASTPSIFGMVGGQWGALLTRERVAEFVGF